jgi:tetratricopeptide (TPR) repeat protein
VALLTSVVVASAPTQAADASPLAQRSELDARLFYQVLVGEIQLNSGDAGSAFQLVLDAARRGKSPQLFRRAIEIALKARAGDSALAAAKAWRVASPESPDALRYEVQLLVALNRPAETAQPLQALLNITPAPQRVALINGLPGLFARSTERNANAALIERVLEPYAKASDTGVAAQVASGRAWLAAGDLEKALALAQRAQARDPTSEAPAGLALEMLRRTPAAEAIVQAHLAAKPDSNDVRLLYVRTLLAAQRYADAAPQLEMLTRTAPEMAPAWLTLGALHLQLHEPTPAIAALEKYMQLVRTDRTEVTPTGAAASASSGATAIGAPVAHGRDTPATQQDALTHGWLLLAQAEEQRGDLKAADAWLSKIDDPRRTLEVQARRASLLVREGKVADALELIRRVPQKTPADVHAKLMVQAQVLREAGQWSDANDLLTHANEQFPNDTDLLYAQSMVLEKLNRLDDMERMLRRVIALEPDGQQAYNALGYALADRNLRLSEARKLIKKALALSPGEPAITDSLGWVEYRLGHRKEALRLLRDAYKAQPDTEIGAHLGEVLWVSGQTDEAKRIWREARTRDADNQVLRETLTRLRVKL